MKTKHILTALALPALLAACNNDEFESMNFEQAQSERPLLSEDFSLKFSDGVETRYAVDGDATLNFVFQSGDQIGAAIIDQFDKDAPKDPSQWDIIESLAGNYPFEYNEQTGVWKASTRLGIGHYLFTYKYNPEDNTRGAVNYILPTVQELYTDENGEVDLNAAIERSNKAISAALLVKDNQPLEAKLRNLYTYPKFVINFDNGLPIKTVSKVVLEYKDESGQSNGFLVKGGLDHKKVWDIFEASEDYEKGADEYFKAEVLNTSDFLRDYKANDGYTTFEYNPYLVAKFPANTAVKVDGTTNNKVVEVRFMMPGAEMKYSGGSYSDGYYKGTLNMYIYTNAGIYQIKDVLEAIKFNKTTSDDAKKRVLVRNASYTLNLDKEAVEPAEKDLYIVTNTTDWNELVEAYGASQANDILISVVGDEFTLNAEAKMPSKATFVVDTPVKVEGAVTLSNVEVTNTVTVENGATLTTSGSFKATKVENNGTMNIAVVTNEDDDVVPYGGVDAIENNGTLNIAKDAKATFALENTKGAVVTNNGEITVSGSNDGEINNKAVIYIAEYSTFVNNKQAEKDDPMPTIENEGRIISKGTFTNDGTVKNNGEITCDAATSGTIDNASTGLIDSAKDMITYITTNEGTIVVYESNPGSDIKVKNFGTIKYTASEASIDFTNSIVTDVIASKTFTISAIGNIKNVTMTAGGTLKIPANAPLYNLTVNGGTVELGSNIIVYEVLKVANSARVIVPEEMQLYAVKMDNKGSILVSGKFITEVSSEAAGLVQAEGPQAEITFGYSPADEAVKDQLKSEYQTAMKAAVKAWANDYRTLNLTVNNLKYDLLNGKKGDTTAKQLFGQYRDANLTTTEQVALTNAFNAYQAVVATATILEYYEDAVKAVVAENEKATAFQTVVKGLTWSVSNGSDRIYKQEGNVSAETAALNDFKAAVADGTISVTNVLDKVTLCTSSTNYAPACSQVFVTDVIYTIFSEDAIALTQDWSSLLNQRYATDGNADNWTLNTVQNWINAVSLSTESSLILDAAKKFITDNNLLSVSKSWTYADEIIKAIVADQAYNK